MGTKGSEESVKQTQNYNTPDKFLQGWFQEHAYKNILLYVFV